MQTPAQSSNEENLFNTNPLSIKDYFKSKMSRVKPTVEVAGEDGKTSGEEKKKSNSDENEALGEEELVGSKARKAKKKKRRRPEGDGEEEAVQIASELGWFFVAIFPQTVSCCFLLLWLLNTLG